MTPRDLGLPAAPVRQYSDSLLGAGLAAAQAQARASRAGVGTLEEQPDEEHAFGPAAPLVKEWRQLQVGGDQAAGRVDRARAAVRRWELEAEMLGEFHLTLPLETHPLDDREGRTISSGDRRPWRRHAGSWQRINGCAYSGGY